MFALLVLNLLCIFVCYSVAKSKGANTSFWAIMGAILGPLAVPFVFFAKPAAKST
ncbi:hypothetical protein [Cognaticolwellia beringensis]|uniref:hypothetical protein n=1 Tax=Cognaticolwellia beringensis TaxID=1967665 RepID=UPI0012FBB335|nr:hypothetical protein [Cognaticolwellia beringensis]